MSESETKPTESEIDTRLCRHCARPANRHGKYLGGCMKDGKALATRFEPQTIKKRPEGR